jgi:prepilin-type processing-associated H-X9-DG protein/prepilin-type N-terminal cleavage/methylation domain-containing protein
VTWEAKEKFAFCLDTTFLGLYLATAGRYIHLGIAMGFVNSGNVFVRWVDGNLLKRGNAFTLIELLVVVSVVVVLMGLLVPAVGRARGSARQATCASCLHQWGIAVNEYAQMYNDWLPRRGQGSQPVQTVTWYDDWFNELPALMGVPAYQDLAAAGRVPQETDHSMWICPELTGVPNVHGNFFGYGMNMALSVRNAPQPDRMNQVGDAATMVFMADANPWYCSVLPYAAPASAPVFNPVARHRGRVNIAFLDGRVDSFDAAYVGCGAGDPKRPDMRWYWYVPGPYPAPWPGP